MVLLLLRLRRRHNSAIPPQTLPPLRPEARRNAPPGRARSGGLRGPTGATVPPHPTREGAIAASPAELRQEWLPHKAPKTSIVAPTRGQTRPYADLVGQINPLRTLHTVRLVAPNKWELHYLLCGPRIHHRIIIIFLRSISGGGRIKSIKR